MIPKLDRLVWKDIVPPWLFGVGLLASLLMAATYLGRVAGFIVDGVPPLEVLELFGLLMMPLLTKTFTMAVLLATLLGFGRLSSDSELVALRAAGASLYRIIFPVAIFSLALAIFTFIFNETFVPIAEKEYKRLTATMAKSISNKEANPFSEKFVDKKKLTAWIVAQNIDPAKQEFTGVTVIAYNRQGQRTYTVYADRLRFTVDVGSALFDPSALSKLTNHWDLSGNVKIVSADLTKVISVDHGWPRQIPVLKENFVQVNTPKNMDADQFTMRDLRQFIIDHEQLGDMEEPDLRDYEYGYWSKIAIPLGAVMFGILGAVLGIRSHRTSSASGYGIAIGLTFGFVLIGNIMNIFAKGGVIPAWSAAFTPILIGSVASGVIMWQRNG